MASIEFINKRIEGKEKELEKLNKKLARIRKVEATGWDDDHNPYFYSEYDLKHCLKDIEEAKKVLEDYKAKLVAETEKANSRDIKIIVDFIENWKALCRDYYLVKLPRYVKAKEEWYTKSSEHADWWNKGGWNDPNKKEIEKAYREYTRSFREIWGGFENYVIGRRGAYEIDMEKLNRELDQEGNRKYDFIVERTNEIVGTITDAKHLRIGDKGDLNGFIVGTRGTAKVETISAGGYNIQCFHFRTLIHEAK